MLPVVFNYCCLGFCARKHFLHHQHGRRLFFVDHLFSSHFLFCPDQYLAAAFIVVIYFSDSYLGTHYPLGCCSFFSCLGYCHPSCYCYCCFLDLEICFLCHFFGFSFYFRCLLEFCVVHSLLGCHHIYHLSIFKKRMILPWLPRSS